MNSGIYLITNTITGKMYVGQSNGIKKRFSRHKRAARIQTKQETFYLHNSIAKHGVDNFKFEILLYSKDRDYLNLMEQRCIDSYNTLSPNGYNLDTGGGVSRTVSEATREKMRKRIIWNKGVPASEDQKKRQSESMMGKPAPNKGKPASEEQKRKQSEAMKGRTAWNKGVPMKEEQRVKLLGLDKSYTKTPEYRAMMSEALKKRVFTPEHRAKIAATKAAKKELRLKAKEQ
jgi:group I intron endonuclease